MKGIHTGMKVLIIEDHEPTRNRLVSLLRGMADYETDAVDCAGEALERIASEAPDLIVLGLGLPGISGAEAIKAIKGLCPSVKILVFTMMEEDEQVYAALKAGALGYVLKDSKPLEILEALEELKSGGAPMSLSIARKVINEFRRLSDQKELEGIVSPLTHREESILKMLYHRDSDRNIADKLSLSTHTIHTHIKNIYSKLHVNSRSEAICEALRKKIIKK